VDLRKQREKDFHDKVFEEETRGKAGVEAFYESANSSKTFYKSFLRDHCPGRRVLEYGCGADGYSIMLAKAGAAVTAIDISDVAIQQSQERARREGFADVRYFVMDAEELTFPDNSFDMICGTAILHHLDYKKALAEIARTLDPDGAAIFVECLGHNPVVELYRRATPHLRTEDEHPLRSDDLETAKKYFAKVELHYFYLLSVVAVPLQKWAAGRLLMRVLEKVDNGLIGLFPFLGKYCWTAILVLSRPIKLPAGNREQDSACCAVSGARGE
jgi:ubiquinone/menaquinone biosynthesis C-methylase UbiE